MLLLLLLLLVLLLLLLLLPPPKNQYQNVGSVLVHLSLSKLLHAGCLLGLDKGTFSAGFSLADTTLSSRKQRRQGAMVAWSGVFQSFTKAAIKVETWVFWIRSWLAAGLSQNANKRQHTDSLHFGGKGVKT